MAGLVEPFGRSGPVRAVESTLVDFLSREVAALDAADPELGRFGHTASNWVLAGGKRLRSRTGAAHARAARRTQGSGPAALPHRGVPLGSAATESGDGIPLSAAPTSPTGQPRHTKVPVRDFEVGADGAAGIPTGVDEQPAYLVYRPPSHATVTASEGDAGGSRQLRLSATFSAPVSAARPKMS